MIDVSAYKHKTIPIFVPHLGCPHDCIFCNQRKITGVREFDLSNVRNDIDSALATISEDVKPEIAFFGGSFTAIDRALMIDLLKIANEYLERGLISSIRCSTRPDCIDDEILSILHNYNLKTIELGVQSMSDKVLEASMRGHTAGSTIVAVDKIISRGFDFVGQMMIGLPMSTLNDEIECAKFIADSGAVGARIYPTVVFANTGLQQLMQNGLYEPLSVEDAVKRSATAAEIFLERSVKLLRIGLCETDSLHVSDGAVGGALHPALGELCASRIFRRRICRLLDDMDIPKNASVEITVPLGALSKAIGQKRSNKFFLIDKYNLAKISFRESESKDLSDGFSVSIRTV